jgi:predicted small lipoprotein YifL
MRVVLTAIAAALLAAGCGLKGPLYLPDKNHTAATPAGAQSQPAQPASSSTPSSTGSPSTSQGTAQPGGTTPNKNDKDNNTQPPQ